MTFTHKTKSHLRVLMVNWLYPPEFSGAAYQCHTLARELITQSVDVEVLTGTNVPSYAGTDYVDGIKVHRVLCDKSNRRQSGKYALDIFSYIFKNRARYDVIHSHGFIAQANLAAQVTALPLVQKITNLNVDDPFAVSKRSMGWALLKLYRKASAVIATSPLLFEISNDMLKRQARVEYIPNGVDLNRFAPTSAEGKKKLRKKLGISSDDIVLLSVGTICHNKGQDMLVNAMNDVVSKSTRRIQLLFVGPDEYVRAYSDRDSKVAAFVNTIKHTVAASGLNKVVRFEGKRDNVDEYYKAADILLHPSRQEGQPNAVIEAMVAGLPVVVNNLADITTEMVKHGHSGFVVQCKDSRLLSSTILSLINNDSQRQRIGRNARKEAANRYDIHGIALRYENLYRNITFQRYARTTL